MEQHYREYYDTSFIKIITGEMCIVNKLIESIQRK